MEKENLIECESNRLTQVMIDEIQRTEKQLIEANRSLSEIGEYQRQSAEYNRITASNSEILKWYTLFNSAAVKDYIE